MMSSEEIQVEKRVAFKGNEGMLSLTASTFRFKPDDSDSEFSESVVEWPVGSITDVHVSPSESSCALVQTRLTFVHDKREQRTVFEFIGDSNESAISGRIRFCSRLDAVRAAAGTLSLQVPASARPSATLSSSQRAELRADFLRDNSDKLMLFKQLVPHLVSETEYWKEEQAALDEYATQRRARSGDVKEPLYLQAFHSSILSPENGTLKVKITAELRQAIFRKYPHVKRAFDEHVTIKRMNEQEFFQHFIASDLFRRELSVLSTDNSDDNARANRFFDEYPSATDVAINWLDQNAKQQLKRRRIHLDIDPTVDLSSEGVDSITASLSSMTERAQQQYRTLRELNCFNMDVVEASVSQRRKESLTSSTEELRLSHIEKLNESLIIQELTTPPQPKYNRLTISDPRPASSSTGALAPTDSVSSAILNKQIAEWCSESRHRRTADASITFSRLCPPAEALRVLVNQSVATRCSDLSASPKARTIQNQSKIAAFGASESTALSDSAIPPEVQEKLYHFDRTCQFQIKRFWDCMMRPLTSPQNFERARVIDSSLGVLAEEIQQYRAELNTSRRQEFSRHFKSVSDKIDRSIIEFKDSEVRRRHANLNVAPLTCHNLTS